MDRFLSNGICVKRIIRPTTSQSCLCWCHALSECINRQFATLPLLYIWRKCVERIIICIVEQRRPTMRWRKQNRRCTLDALTYHQCVWTVVCFSHRISIPAYAIEQRWWQPGVPKNEMSLMSLIFKTDARSLATRVTTWLSFKNLLTR
jgi:hypothetical protein